MQGNETTPEAIKRAVFYADGGFHNTDNAGGWGVHGYLYEPTPATKGTGNPKALPTAEGYADEKPAKGIVTVTQYVDMLGGVPVAASNNHTEQIAMQRAIEFVLEHGIHHATVYTDSMYVVNGINKYLPRWKANGWMTTQGEEVANRAQWETLDQLMGRLQASKAQIDVRHIHGHSGLFGNCVADDYARKGNALGLRGLDTTFRFVDTPEGYWSTTHTYNRLLSQGKWYFTTLQETPIRTEDGRWLYCIGDHGKEDDWYGKRMADNSMTVLYLKSPDPVLEILRNHAIDTDRRQIGSVIIGHLGNILKAGNYQDMLRYGPTVLKPGVLKMDLVSSGKEPILIDQKPMGLAYQGLEAIESLRQVLDRTLAGHIGYVVTDITEQLYEREPKKDQYKLKKHITVPTKYLDLQVRYSLVPMSETSESTVNTTKLRLILGTDTPKRNALAAIAEQVVRVAVVTWRISDTVFRYATLVETTEDVGIWGGIDSNFHMVTKRS